MGDNEEEQLSMFERPPSYSHRQEIYTPVEPEKMVNIPELNKSVQGDPNPPAAPKSTRHITKALRNLIAEAENVMLHGSITFTDLEAAVAEARAALLASPRHGRNATETSVEAARSRPKGISTENHRKVLALLRSEGPATDMELETRWERRYGPTWTRSGISARRRELCDAGLVRDSGHRRGSGRPGNKPSIVWEAI